MTTGASDAELVRAHVAGDRAALASIYDRYAPSLFDTATALLGDRDEAADVVQDTFLAAHQHLARLRDPSRLRAWLFAVARHEVERRGRKRRRAVPTATVADMAPLRHARPRRRRPGHRAGGHGPCRRGRPRRARPARPRAEHAAGPRRGRPGRRARRDTGAELQPGLPDAGAGEPGPGRARGGPHRPAGLRRAGRDPPGLGRHLLRAGPQAGGAPRRAVRHL